MLLKDNMPERKFKQISLLVLALMLLAIDGWSATAYALNQPLPKQNKQRNKNRSKGWFCASAYEIRIVDAKGEIVGQTASGVILGTAVRKVEPGYPTQAVKDRIEGIVVIEAVGSETGDIASIKSVSGPPTLTTASAEAAKRWRFTPTTLEAVPVRAIAKITFRYHLGLENNRKKTRFSRSLLCPRSFHL